MIELTEEYREAARKYRKAFGYGVPLSMLPPTVTTAELIRRIDSCVQNGKDDLLDSYQVEIHPDELV